MLLLSPSSLQRMGLGSLSLSSRLCRQVLLPGRKGISVYYTRAHAHRPDITTLEQFSLHPRASPLGVLPHRFLLREHKSLPGFCLHEGLGVLKGEKDKSAERRRWKYWSLQQVLDVTIHSENGEVHRSSELWHYRQKYVYAVHKTVM